MNMKKFSITIARHEVSYKTVEVIAETEKEARGVALNMSGNGLSFTGKEETFEVAGVVKEEYPYIDREGKPYDPEVSLPVGGGLHKDCEFNADALYAYYIVKDRWEIARYLVEKGFFECVHGEDMEVWFKGNTKITYEGYGSGMWGYMCTDCIE